MTLKQLCSDVDGITVSGEQFTNLISFYHALSHVDTNELEVIGGIITPFYIENQKRYELYQYELHIEDSDGVDFQDFLENETGCKMTDLPDEILEIRRNCFLKVDSKNDLDTINRLYKYFRYIRDNKNIKSEIVGIFGEFDPENLYIEVYEAE